MGNNSSSQKQAAHEDTPTLREFHLLSQRVRSLTQEVAQLRNQLSARTAWETDMEDLIRRLQQPKEKGVRFAAETTCVWLPPKNADADGDADANADSELSRAPPTSPREVTVEVGGPAEDNTKQINTEGPKGILMQTRRREPEPEAKAARYSTVYVDNHEHPLKEYELKDLAPEYSKGYSCNNCAQHFTTGRIFHCAQGDYFDCCPDCIPKHQRRK
eukprot:TRINITY_DN1292_c0_g1_i3.p1 TRINITY_DN1292_c0_g1~~TRINITY_DN1292_c0_g1_i3.p1  ORF type:complete len:216 (+),score=65.29 TRINITY_DN1292_c0_g1_i3:289-936(+)